MKDSTKGKAMKVLFAGMAAVGAAFCPMNVGAAIYVNGVNASVKTSGGGSSDSPTYWRVTDGRIVLRGRGPYVIQGSGTMPIRCSNTDSGVANVTISNLTVTATDKEYGAFDCGSQVVYLTVAGDNRLTSTVYSANPCIVLFERTFTPAERTRTFEGPGITFRVEPEGRTYRICTTHGCAAGGND